MKRRSASACIIGALCLTTPSFAVAEESPAQVGMQKSLSSLTLIVRKRIEEEREKLRVNVGLPSVTTGDEQIDRLLEQLLLPATLNVAGNIRNFSIMRDGYLRNSKNTRLEPLDAATADVWLALGRYGEKHIKTLAEQIKESRRTTDRQRLINQLEDLERITHPEPGELYAVELKLRAGLSEYYFQKSRVPCESIAPRADGCGKLLEAGIGVDQLINEQKFELVEAFSTEAAAWLLENAK